MPDRTIDTILGLLDRLAPVPRPDSREARRRARAAVAAALIGCVILSATAATSVALGLDTQLVPLNVAWAGGVLLLVWLARRLHSTTLLGNSLVVVAFAHTLLLSSLAGGRNVGALFAFSVFPVLAVLLAGWRSGLVFTGLAATAVVITPTVPLALLAPPGLARAPVEAALVRDALNVIFAVGLVAVLYDVARNSTLRDAEESRARAESASDRQQQLVDLSRQLHEATGDHFDRVLGRVMGRTARLAGANRTLLQLLPAAGTTGRFTWGAEPVGWKRDHPAMRDPSEARETFRWTSERIRAGRITQVARLDDLPAEAVEERAYLESRGVVSWLCVPIRAGGRTIGFQSFETTDREKTWDEEEVAALSLMTELLAATILRHRTAEALRESEQKFALAFHDHPDAMIIMDLTTEVILECNEQWLREAGHESREAVLGRRPWDFGFTVSDAERSMLRRRLETDGRAPAIEVPLVGRGGEQRTYLVSASRIDLGGRPCALANIHDITLRKQLEQQLLHAQKMEAVGRLAGGIAHDYNNMLTVISGYSGSLVASLDGELRRDAEEIQEAARRSAELTRQLLAFSRRQVLRDEVLDANALVSGLESMLRPLIGESVELIVRLAAAPAHVRSDRGQLEQAVVNLVVNARDAMPEGGMLRVETRRITLPDPETAAPPVSLGPGEYVVITVADEGAGMDAELIEHAMEPFYTTKPEGQGTGLGLPMAHGLARQCGGALVLDSEPGRGTRAGIYLPAAVSEPLHAEVEPSTAPVAERASSSCVLLVEDEATVRRLASRILRGAGYTVVEAENGEDALRRAETLIESLDVVVSDVVMPVLSGTVLVRTLRSERPELPVVLMSGYANDAEGSPIPDDVVFLLKPFGPDRLCEAVDRALRTKATESA